MKVLLIYSPLLIFNTEIIESLTTTCQDKIPAITDNPSAGITGESDMPGANISSITNQWLIVAVQSNKYYTSIGMIVNANNMHYSNLLFIFKIRWDTYE